MHSSSLHTRADTQLVWIAIRHVRAVDGSRHIFVWALVPVVKRNEAGQPNAAMRAVR